MCRVHRLILGADNIFWSRVTSTAPTMIYWGRNAIKCITEICFGGIAKKPKLFCLPPELVGKNIARPNWGWLPIEPNYTYPSFRGQNIEAHVYADADEVELLVDGEPLE